MVSRVVTAFGAHCIPSSRFAYAYTLRTFSLTSFASLPLDSTERSTVAEMMAQLVPFLVEKSSVIFENVDSAVEHVVARETSEVRQTSLSVRRAHMLTFVSGRTLHLSCSLCCSEMSINCFGRFQSRLSQLLPPSALLSSITLLSLP